MIGQKLVVRALSPGASRGAVALGGLAVPCALGRTGRRAIKREGDGASPVGTFRMIRVLFRPDRMARPRTALAVRAIHRNDGWCDDPRDRNYNRLVRHPYPASAEQMWRTDCLYDVVVILDHNRRPRIRGRGSAIFVHIARPDWRATAGCVALRRGDLVRLLGHLRPGTSICIPS